MARLFIAIDFPSEVCDRISDICFGVRGTKWVPRDQYHLTLKFLGETEDIHYEAIVDTLDGIQIPQFTLTLKGVGFFPPRRSPNILWIGIEKNAPLTALQQHIESALDSIGIEKEKRKFHPHLTIGRIRERLQQQELIPFLQSNSLFSSSGIPVTQFHLYSSVLRPTGPIHQLEHSFTLEEF